MMEPLLVVHKYEKLEPLDEPLPFKFTTGCGQVIKPFGPAFATGGVVFSITITVIWSVQPFTLSVINNV